jgi:hypothetical protein
MGGRVPVSTGRESRQRQRTHGETMEEAEKVADILGKGGEGRAWRHDTGLWD